jgi:hypothetical protein
MVARPVDSTDQEHPLYPRDAIATNLSLRFAVEPSLSKRVKAGDSKES